MLCEEKSSERTKVMDEKEEKQMIITLKDGSKKEYDHAMTEARRNIPEA